MKIKHNASPSEESSPFYQANKAFCFEIEKYVTSKGGTLEGKFNAWSYIVEGEVFEKKKWNITYKKATFSSSGNLLLSSKHQCLLVLVKWKTEIKNTNNTGFQIRRKTLLDSIKMLFNKSIKELSPNSKYITIQKGNKSDLIPKLYQILKPLFNLDEVFEVDYQNNLLTVELRTPKHYFDLLEKIISKL